MIVCDARLLPLGECDDMFKYWGGEMEWIRTLEGHTIPVMIVPVQVERK